MKYLIIAIIFGGLAYYLFVYDSSSQQSSQIRNEMTDEEQALREELGVEDTSYQGAITKTYESMKNAVQDAKDVVSATEKNYQN